jgi:phosphoglycerate dehydrogenase-like enzyme
VREEEVVLRVTVATPLTEELCSLVCALEPRIDLVRDQRLLPPMRWPGDHSGDPAFVRTGAQQHRFEALMDSADALYGIPDESPAALKRVADDNSGLRWVQTMAAGGGAQVRRARLDPAQLDRIAFTSSAGIHAGPLSEFALFGILAGLKGLHRLESQKRSREWSGRWAMGQLARQTVLIVGLGGIGRELAGKLDALGATVWGTSRRGVSVEHVERLIRPSDLASMVESVDAIVVTLPGTHATAGMIDADVLQHTKPGTTLVSVGRGTVIDESAMLAALMDGHLGFAALDVFESEPLSPESPLWELDNVLISPHTAALDVEEDRRIAELFAANATRLLDGAPLLNEIDKVEFY